ncbi:MAG: inositol monophosphatase family protein [Candidatus Paceibacterota bacterium]|jgi:myo-inositol-1(or 4)-monophosphatase
MKALIGLQRFSFPVVSAAQVALIVGKIIRGGSLPKNTRSTRSKENFRAIVTPTDVAAQELIILLLSALHPEAKFLAEEKTERYSNLLLSTGRNDPNYVFSFDGLRFDVDSIDGTAMQALGLPDWSVAIAVWEDDKLIAGVVYMPEIRGGTLVIGEIGKGVLWLEEDGGIEREPKQDQTRVWYWGADLDLLPLFNQVKNELATKTRRLLTANSGSMALAMIACGIADGVIQDHQAIWDITPGMAIINALGGKVILYRHEVHRQARRIIRLENLDEISYRRTKTNVRRTALIATRDSQQAEKLWKILEKIR